MAQFVSFYSSLSNIIIFYFLSQQFFSTLLYVYYFSFFSGGKLKKSLRSLVSFFFRKDEKLFLNFSIFLPLLCCFFYDLSSGAKKRKIISFVVAHSLHIFHFSLFMLYTTKEKKIISSSYTFSFLTKFVLLLEFSLSTHFWLLTSNSFPARLFRDIKRKLFLSRNEKISDGAIWKYFLYQKLLP